ncbi:MAG: hypothetical protein AMXMBFR13_50740 [Phycisphaerae bacterium]
MPIAESNELRQTTAPASAELRTAPADEKRWPASMAFFTYWLIPARSSLRTAHVPLRRAWGVHLGAAVALVLLFFLLAAWEGVYRGERFWDRFFEMIGQALSEVMRYPLEAGAAILATIVGVQLGYLLLAVLVMAWGAKDEPVRASYRHALRVVWLRSTHVLPFVLLFGLVMIPLVNASREWWAGRGDAELALPELPSPPDRPGRRASVQEHQDYAQAMLEYQQQSTRVMAEHRELSNRLWEERWNSRPWYIKHDDEIAGGLGLFNGIWLMWALYRGLGTRGPIPPIKRPPLCEACGYNLTGMLMEARCPECGEPVADSLGPQVRPGPPWATARGRGTAAWLSAWWQCTVDPIIRPARFGRQVQVSSSTIRHRSFLLVNMIPMAVAGAFALIGCYVADMHRSPLVSDPELAYLGAPASAIGSATTGLTLLVIAAALVGWSVGKVHGRNLMPASMQIAAYLSGYLAICFIASAGLGIAMVALADQHLLMPLQRSIHMDEELLAFLGWMIPTAAMLLYGLVLLWKGTAAARFANK